MRNWQVRLAVVGMFLGFAVLGIFQIEGLADSGGDEVWIAACVAAIAGAVVCATVLVLLRRSLVRWGKPWVVLSAVVAAIAIMSQISEPARAVILAFGCGVLVVLIILFLVVPGRALTAGPREDMGDE